MLGFDSKRDIIKGEFAKRIWRMVLAMWRENNETTIDEPDSKFEVKWQ